MSLQKESEPRSMKNKIQLILLVEEETNPALIKNQDLSGYEKVDLLYWGSFTEMMKNYADLASPRFTLRNVMFDVQHHINEFVSKDCAYYVVSETLTDLEKLPKELDRYSEGRNFPLLLVKPISNEDYTGLIVNTLLHTYLCGFGAEQNIMEKIEIFAKNNQVEHAVYSSLDEFYKAKPNRRVWY
jgi:hypothetical protein